MKWCSHWHLRCNSERARDTDGCGPCNVLLGPEFCGCCWLIDFPEVPFGQLADSPTKFLDSPSAKLAESARKTRLLRSSVANVGRAIKRSPELLSTAPRLPLSPVPHSIHPPQRNILSAELVATPSILSRRAIPTVLSPISEPSSPSALICWPWKGHARVWSTGAAG
jgi:hypothetical protein